MKKEPTYAELRTWRAVAQARNLTAGASRLRLSRGTVQKTLRSLQDKVSVLSNDARLYELRGNQVVPTRFGDALSDFISNAIKQVDGVADFIQNYSTDQNLRVCAPLTIWEDILFDELARIGGSTEPRSVEMHIGGSSAAVAGVISGEYDIAFAGKSPLEDAAFDRSRFEVVDVGDYPVYLLVRDEHSLARDTKFTDTLHVRRPASEERMRWIVDRIVQSSPLILHGEHAAFRAHVDAVLGTIGRSLPRDRTNAIETGRGIVNAVRAGLGIGIHWLVDPDRDLAGNVRGLPLGRLFPPWSICAFWEPGRSHHHASELIETISYRGV